MEPRYDYAESTNQPQPVEICESTVYLRTDIAEQKRSDDQGNKIVYWTYQEAKLTMAEFSAYAGLIVSRNAVVGIDDSSKISQLVVGQENEGDNQLIIMEAIADLYDILAALM